MDYNCDSAGTAANYACMCEAVSQVRSGGKLSSGAWKRKLEEDNSRRG